ncbi:MULTISPECIES: DUF6843 domain-containing protein [Bacillus]|uniref:DUF6843 domain-containing protein n=1 Tax=Bacillus TaxID=1386 RepID=UPI0011407AC1|nr:MULTISPECIES: hypothetical protein [Bacillus]MCA1035816.1 hypothetical protein [Bacillus infantis]MCP1157133.1 hypothetical protein [Bacillus infantis]MDT0162961.1 hypothetical protein [Bacillus sp. AG4(2022)]
MFTRIGLAALALIILVTVYRLIAIQEGVDQTYLLPMGFEGCVVINYNVKGARPLKIDNNEIVYKVPKSGVLNTSSPSDFGWVNEQHSGGYQLRAFYVDGKGNKIKELHQEKIRFGANGAAQEEGKPERQYSYQIFGSEDIENKGCPALDR